MSTPSPTPEQPQPNFGNNPATNPQMEPPKKKRGGCMKWGLIIFGVLILLGAISSVLGGDEDGAVSTDTGASSDGAEVAAPEEEKEVAAPEEKKKAADNETTGDDTLQIGETADIKGLKITADGFRDDGADVLGNNHICTDVAITNDSNKAVDFNQFDFNLTTPAGITVDSTITTSGDFQTAKVNPGGSMSGTVCFESAAEPGEYKLGYEPLWAMRKAYWTSTF
ncbi:DUF4352 domain-containing protein [Corynebacterium hadale]|nr:DUF4352 domain-containing protein [Corynebacterium hadale]